VSIADAAIRYISPTGSNAAAGTTGAPWRTFEYAFGEISGGDTLYLKPGTYSEAAGTGYISWEGTGSGQPPSGVSRTHMTLVAATVEDSTFVTGVLFLGRSDRKDTCIYVRGITFNGGVHLYNNRHCVVKNCGGYNTLENGGVVFEISPDGDHQMGCTNNLIEDCWAWGQNRGIALDYIADSNTWRRVVIRGDGCNSAACVGSGNPNVGISCYASKRVTFQNLIIVDRVLGGGEPYANFATAEHAQGNLGPLKVQGCISLNGPDEGYYFEAENANDSTFIIENSIAWDMADDGFSLQNHAFPHTIIRRCTSGYIGGDNAFRTVEVTSALLDNLLSINATTYSFSCNIQPQYVCAYNGGTYNQTTPAHPITTDPGMRYICRIESNSTCHGTGSNGSDIGANILYRYGLDGTFFGEPGYDSLTTISLWPYPNEARIRRDFLRYNNESDESRGFCDDAVAASLTEYVWEYQYRNEAPSFGGSPVKITWVGGSSTNAALAANYSPAQAPTSIDTILLNTGSVDFVVGSVLNVAYVSQVTGYTGIVTINDTLKTNYLGLGTCVASFNAPCVIRDSVVYASESTPTGNAGSKIISVSGSTLRVRLNGNVGTPRVVMTSGSKIKW